MRGIILQEDFDGNALAIPPNNLLVPVPVPHFFAKFIGLIDYPIAESMGPFLTGAIALLSIVFSQLETLPNYNKALTLA
ncbi:MAG: hypothetical protein ACXWTP_09905 [Methylosarcina sp.]